MRELQPEVLKALRMNRTRDDEKEIWIIVQPSKILYRELLLRNSHFLFDT